MDDFFRAIYENTLNTGALKRSNNPEYRRAFSQLERLVDKLSKENRNALMNAFYEVLSCSDLDILAYGFRLGVRVTASDRL